MARWVERNIKYIFILPSVLFVAVMIVFPIGYTAYISLFEWSMSSTQAPKWVSFGNYAKLLQDARFWSALGRTFYFTLISIIVELMLGVIIAVLFNRKLKGINLFKTLFLLPMVATPVSIGLVWLLIFEPTIGVANRFIGMFGLKPQMWIASPSQVIPSLALVDIWEWTPMITLIALAGLTSIPQDNYEAAQIDGASSWQMFWKITLPLLLPTVFSAALLRIIDAVKTYDIIYAMTQGGPGYASETLNILGFSLGFQYFQLGYASSLLMLFFFLVLGISSLIIILRKRIEVLQ
ncbi:ABC transporter permease [Gordoniibacillus kamchatkensis]|uniref:ABC transporter permease n=1 Tax=Gordoniibacillus kamchatkensis TaxID=1590651 RepID=A0ABR5AHH5_9BACL|nr:sugar ABC transporter permease [Paenibacillus sp. VKM B-2647]KIL40431.1 ABC transporter permease [Paenibacillus sp. VKM B-2647]